MKKKYELSLTKDYVLNWSIQDALREIVQNAIDQEVQNNSKFSIDYDAFNNILRVANKESTLSKKSLLLGYTSKETDKETIGQFGEGLKVALLVLNRLGKKVTIYNYGEREIWTSRFVKAKRYEGEEILTIFVETESIWRKVPDNDLTIEIEGISPNDMEELKNRTLQLKEIKDVYHTEYGKILLDKNESGRIYTNGLFITTIKDICYGYDIKPEFLEIGRDRNLVRDFDIIWMTSRMWEAYNNNNKSINLIEKLIDNNSREITYIDANKCSDEIKKDLYSNFKNKYGDNAIAITTEDEKEVVVSNYIDAKPVIVNKKMKEFLDSSSEYKNSFKNLKRKELSIEEEYYYWKSKNIVNIPIDTLLELESIIGKVIDLDKVNEIELSKREESLYSKREQFSSIPN